MALLNYTTTVSAAKTIGQIQGLLVQAGARSVSTQYDEDGNPTGIAFSVVTPYGQRGFALPINSASVYRVLERDRVPARYLSPEQAERVAWRILKDWVEAQLAIIRTEMVTLDQVMLPYMHDEHGRTVYDLYRDQQLAITAGE